MGIRWLDRPSFRSWWSGGVDAEEVEKFLLEWSGSGDERRRAVAGGNETQAGEGFEDEPASGPGGVTEVAAGHLHGRGDRGPDGAFDFVPIAASRAVTAASSG